MSVTNEQRSVKLRNGVRLPGNPLGPGWPGGPGGPAGPGGPEAKLANLIAVLSAETCGNTTQSTL